jgi:hypothetical protein
MAFKVYKFRDINELDGHLNGAVRAGSGKGSYDVVGKTLIFTEPGSFTVTFTAGSLASGHLSLKDLCSQIVAQSTNTVNAWSQNGVLALRQKVPATSGGIAISSASTALSELGFGGGSAVLGRVYAYADGVSAPVAPFYVDSYSDGSGGLVLIVQE